MGLLMGTMLACVSVCQLDWAKCRCISTVGGHGKQLMP